MVESNWLRFESTSDDGRNLLAKTTIVDEVAAAK